MGCYSTHGAGGGPERKPSGGIRSAFARVA